MHGFSSPRNLISVTYVGEIGPGDRVFNLSIDYYLLHQTVAPIISITLRSTVYSLLLISLPTVPSY